MRPSTGQSGTGFVLDRIKPMGFDESIGRKFMLYGDSGSGKTTLWSSFPKPILAVICSGGRDPGELRSIDTPEMQKVVSTVDLESPSELDQITGAIESGALVHTKTGKPYKTVVLDHVSGFQDLKLMAYKGLSSVPQQKHFGIATKPDWSEIAGQLKEHLVKMMNVVKWGINTVIIAQERIFLPREDESGKIDLTFSDVIKPKVGCAVIPSLALWLNPTCDYVLQTYRRPRMVTTTQTITIGKNTKEVENTVRDRGVEFVARCAPHDVFMGKFRCPDVVLPEAILLGDSITGVIKNPSGYEKIIALIKEGKLL